MDSLTSAIASARSPWKGASLPQRLVQVVSALGEQAAHLPVGAQPDRQQAAAPPPLDLLGRGRPAARSSAVPVVKRVCERCLQVRVLGPELTEPVGLVLVQ